MRCTVATLLVLAGCDQVLGLTPRDAAIDAPVDAPVDAAPDAPICGGGPATEVSITTAGDSILVSTTTQVLSDTPQIYLSFGRNGMGPVHHGVWMFRTTQFPADRGKIVRLRMTLPYLPFDDACGGACGACTDFEEAGALELYPISSDWLEGQVTWVHRNKLAALLWNIPGAGGTDRGPLAATVMHAPEQAAVFEITGSALADTLLWERATALSFVVVPKATSATTGARMITVGAPPDVACGPPPLVSLAVSYCP